MRGVTRRGILASLGAVGSGALLPTAADRARAQTAGEWPQHRADAANTGFHPDAVPPTGSVGRLWTGSIGDTLPPVTDGERVYVSDDGGRLLALPVEGGSPVWSATPGDSPSTPVIHAEYVIAGGEDGIHAFRRTDGTRVWTASTTGPPIGPLRLAESAAGDRQVYAMTAAGAVHAVAVADGSRAWRQEGYSLRPAPAAATLDAVVVPTERGPVALDAVDGTELWWARSGGVTPPVYRREGGIVFKSGGETLTSRSVTDGSVRWEHTFDTGPVRFPAAVGPEFLVVPAGASLRVFRPENEESLDTIPLPEEPRFPPVVAGGGDVETHWVVVSDSGTVYAGRFDEDGPAWSHDSGATPYGSPAVADGRLFLATDDGLQVLGEDGTPGATATPTPSGADSGGTVGSEGTTPTRNVAEPNPDPSQAIPLPEGLPVVPLSGATLLGAAGLAALARRAAGDDDADGADSGRSGGSGGSSSATGRGGSTGASPGGGSTTGGGTTGSGSTTTSSSGTGSTTGTGGSTTSGSAGGTGTLPYPVGDPGNRPTSVPRTPDLDLSYDDLDRGDRIGTGGNADVYRATAPGPDGPVELAVKEPRMEGTLHRETVERVAREAETWAQLDDHDHIVGVVDWGSTPFPWIAMEYMDAGHLEDRLAATPALVERLWVGYGVVKGVRHAHERGIAHLDLKPENVLFRSADGWPVPKVADWGLSRHLLEHSDTVEGLTPAYAAPEQFEADRGQTDNVTDVYQLGAVLYELFTGQPPFEGPAPQVMHGVLHEAPDPPSAIAPGLPEAVDEMVMRALATDRGERYDSVLYLRDDIQEIVRSL